MVVKMGFRLPYLQIIRWLYVQVRFILTNFAEHAAIHGKAHLCDVIFWNSPCVFAMRCGKIEHSSIFCPRSKSGSACIEMIHGFNPLNAKLFNLNFHPLEVVKIIEISQNGGQLFSNIADWCYILCLICIKDGTYCANKKWRPECMRHRRLKG